MNISAEDVTLVVGAGSVELLVLIDAHTQPQMEAMAPALHDMIATPDLATDVFGAAVEQIYMTPTALPPINTTELVAAGWSALMEGVLSPPPSPPLSPRPPPYAPGASPSQPSPPPPPEPSVPDGVDTWVAPTPAASFMMQTLQTLFKQAAMQTYTDCTLPTTIIAFAPRTPSVPLSPSCLCSTSRSATTFAKRSGATPAASKELAAAQENRTSTKTLTIVKRDCGFALARASEEASAHCYCWQWAD